MLVECYLCGESKAPQSYDKTNWNAKDPVCFSCNHTIARDPSVARYNGKLAKVEKRICLGYCEQEFLSINGARICGLCKKKQGHYHVNDQYSRH